MGQGRSLNPRCHAYRHDLADVGLSSLVEAEKFVTPVMKQCIRGVLPLFESPSEEAQQISQIRYGEFVDVFELRSDGFAWVQNRSDHYVGYVPSADVFGDHIADLSYRVIELRTYLYAKPDITAQPIDELTLGSFVTPVRDGGFFYELANGGFLVASHVRKSALALSDDYVYTAGRLLGVPFLAGGRTALGVDASGLIQLSLDLAGYECPRDYEEQRDLLALPLEGHWRDHNFKRGEIIYFSDHVGMMTSADHFIHASPWLMKVVVEPLSQYMKEGEYIEAIAEPRR